MTTPYGVSTSSGSINYNNYVKSSITGPLSTSNYPFAMVFHNNGILKGLRPTPPQFYPYQSPPYAEQNTNARFQYIRATSKSVCELKKERALGILSPPNSIYNISTGRRTPVSTHMNYISPTPSSLYINSLKSRAVGKSGYKVGLPIDAPITTKNYDVSYTRSCIRRVRSSGCVAPKKKGAIENTSLRNGAVCSWGALPRQTY